MKTGRFSVLLGFITTHCRENSNQENGIPFWVSCPQWPNDLPLGPMSQRFHHLPHCTVQTGTQVPNTQTLWVKPHPNCSMNFYSSFISMIYSILLYEYMTACSFCYWWIFGLPVLFF
jgi:hypothetical protein